LGSAEIIPVISPKAKAAGPSSDLDKVQYLRQDMPEVCWSGSGKSGNCHGKQPGASGELKRPWKGGQPLHSLACECPVPAGPVARASLFHGSGANPRLLPGFFFLLWRKMTFWSQELEWKKY